MAVGIETINAYVGQAYLDIQTLFKVRELDVSRFSNLMMEQKTIGIPCEDPVTNGVNAAKRIIDQLSEVEKNQIEMVVTSTESGLDFGKSLSTYIHKYLSLSRRCRLFEVKQACYGGTAALQTAVNFVAANASPSSKVLVIATDIARAAIKHTYAEPSQGVAAVAMLVSQQPDILELDFGANGYYGYEVMDTCRPEPDIETGDPDLSLLSYLDCLAGAFQNYSERVEGADFQNTFDLMCFHTPFGGMVKGAHRKMMRDLKKMPADQIETDFLRRVAPSLVYCVRTGNAYSAMVYLALASTIDNAAISGPARVGIFSYGSGCSSEFYSGVITPSSKQKLAPFKIAEALKNRYELSMEQYEKLSDLDMEIFFGIKNKIVDTESYKAIYEKQFAGKGLLVLKTIEGYHRKYDWS